MAKKPKKPIKKLSTGAVSRSFSIAKLGLSAGARAAGHAMSSFFGDEAVQKVKKKVYVMEQLAALTVELGKLKGSLMKAGQMLSIHGEHFLPPEANQILKALQSDSPPLEWTEIRKILLKQLGKEKLAELEIEEESYAAASLGQVHRARVKKSGREIVLKVQYPGVDKAVDGDLQALKRILSFTEWLPKLPATDELFAEVRMMLKRELDYEKELEMLQLFRAKLAGDARYVIPEPLPEYCGKRVLAMSFEPGEAVDSEAVATLSQERRNRLAQNVLDLYFRELFEWRQMQTDPHFGNYRIRIDGKGKSDQVILYDYGAIREFSADFMERYRAMLAGIFHSDRAAFESGAQRLGVLGADDPEELKSLFYQLCLAIVEPFAKEGSYDWKQNDLPKRVTATTWEIIKRFPLRAPPREAVFLDRKMIGMFTFMAVLGAKFSARAMLAEYLDK